MKPYLFLAILSLLALPDFAQKKQRPQNTAIVQTVPKITKRAINHQDYDNWQSVSQRQITPNGAWAAYAVTPQDGDGSVVFHSLKDGRRQTIQRASEVRLTENSDWAVFRIKPANKLAKEAKRAKKKKDDMPKDSLGLYSFSKNTTTIVPSVQSFKLPEKASGWVAILKEAQVLPKDTSKKTTTPKGKKAPKKEGEETGYTLIIKNLTNNTDKSFGFVTDYEVAKNGKYAAFATTGNDSTLKAGVYVYDPEKDVLTNIYSAQNKQKFKRLAFDESGNQLAFVADLDTNAKVQIRNPKLFCWKNQKTELLADAANNPAPKGWLVSANYSPSFSKDGSKLFFGTNPKPIVQDTTLLPEEIVNVEVWNYKDTRLQTQQKVTLEQDRKKSYLAAVDLTNNQSTQLGTLDTDAIEVVNEGNADWVLATTNEPYTNQHWDWNPRTDAYVLNIKTGAKTLIKKDIKGSPRVSPVGKYVYWFSNSDTAWVAYNVATKAVKKLTYNKNFADEDDDHPDFPNPYGIAGWTSDDAEILVYDKYDIWSISPETGNMNNLTQTGRSQKITHRYIKLDPEARNIDVAKPLMVRTFNNVSMGSGYGWLSAQNRSVAEAFKCDCNVLPMVVKAKNTDDLLITKSSFREFPDLWHSDLTMKNLQKISNLGSQMDGLKWGTVELVNYKATDGTALQGLLYKPDDFDPTKKYPMLVYFYEKFSENLHNFSTPQPTTGVAINYAYATSNGYVVFVPDIVYQIGYPGRSAFNCVMPGVLSVLDKGFIDRNRVAVTGHSWGGYQAAYLVTQTNLFKTSVLGAPVANMTSAYSGIRLESGRVRQAQYEFTQSRIGGTIWQKPMQFIENSPLFHLDKVQTPSLIFHNDEDNAVPWSQGIELFLGLKRLEKPTWMLVYNGEKHHNLLRRNQKDFTTRLWQYLDHYLKDAPAPSWMKDGLPMMEKGINQHLETK